MTIYEISWSAYGRASVEAESEREALELATDACFDFDDPDFERNEVDGADVEIA